MRTVPTTHVYRGRGSVQDETVATGNEAVRTGARDGQPSIALFALVVTVSAPSRRRLIA